MIFIESEDSLMKKLIYFSHGLSANGIEIFLFNVINKLDKSKYDITVAMAIDEGVEAINEKAITDIDVKVIHLGDLDGVNKKIQYLKNVKAILNNDNYDIVHSHMDLLNGIILKLAKKAGIHKRICHAHNAKSQFNISGDKPFYLEILQKVYYKFMKRLIIKNSTDFLACSDMAAKYFYDEHPFETIYNGIFLDRFKLPSSFNRELYSLKLNLDPEKKHIITIGRISGPKNPFFALEIIYELTKIRNDFQYIWVGAGELEQEMREKVSQLGLENEIKLIGVRSDINQILGCCDCFLLPSLSEGLGIVLIEAQASNLTCVASTAVPILANCGKCKFIPLNEPPANWAQTVSDILDNKINLNLDQKKLMQFDINHTVSQLEEIYDKTL